MNSNGFEMQNEMIISADEIKLILDRYRIGKKPLAKLLGWGETTIIRYMEGDIPTSEYSNKLRTILDDPEFYYNLLCKRKDCLTGIAFKKSKKAVISKIMSTKIYAAAFYIVNRGYEDICASYIQYILLYAQAFSLALYDKEIFQEEIMINERHIPFPKLYDGMKRCGLHKMEGADEFLEEDEMKLIDSVMEAFLWYGPKALSAMAANERSLLRISRDKYNNKIVAKDSLKAFFKDIISQYHIEKIQSIHNYPDNRIFVVKEQYK